MSARSACAVAGTLVAVAVGGAAGQLLPSSPVPDLVVLLTRVGQRVQQYYRRAERVVCVEQVTLQSLGNGFSPDDFARVLEYELRVEWGATTDGDLAPEAKVIRTLLKINGRPPKPNAEPGCMDPKGV